MHLLPRLSYVAMHSRWNTRGYQRLNQVFFASPCSCSDVVVVSVGVAMNVFLSPCSCSDIVAVCVGVAVKSATSSFTARPLLQVLVACVVVVLQLLGY